MTAPPGEPGAEERRLAEDRARTKNWKRFGPYLAERQWGTVREDYSAGGAAWDSFPHDHARSRAYRWGEDGLLGFTDRECRIALAFALWNGKDPILKERMFGLSGPEGNHGEDVKECWYYLDCTPTSSYVKTLYKYPQAAYPYTELLRENAERGRGRPEYEIEDTGVFDDGYFDVVAEYAKASPDDVHVRLTIFNRALAEAEIHVLPTLWYRNFWAWGREGEEGYGPRPQIRRTSDLEMTAAHSTLGTFLFAAAPDPAGGVPSMLFTENETNYERLFDVANPSPFVKDAFHRYVLNGERSAVNPDMSGTKAAFLYRLKIPAQSSQCLHFRLVAEAEAGEEPHESAASDALFEERIRESEEFWTRHLRSGVTAAEAGIVKQARAGLLSSRQFYYYVVRDWLAGDPSQPPPPQSRKRGRNADWPHVYNRDVLSMPDKWEYPWYASWDLAFHTVELARFDPDYAKNQLVLLLREWYLHPNGAVPAYEYAFSDANPPVHAWAAWRVYKRTAPAGTRDRSFLARVFQKLLLNFTWWVNRKDVTGNHLFAGGFLGLDNIGVFDRSKPLPTGGTLEQADGTAWMAFYAGTMLSIALELAKEEEEYGDMASKFFEHYVAIVDAMNELGGSGLWDEEDGFYYDRIRVEGRHIPLKVRSLVGLIPLIAVDILELETIDAHQAFKKRLHWFLQNRPELSGQISYLEACGNRPGRRLLAIPSRERLVRVLRYMLDENEFLSPYGIRSLSKFHEDHPYEFPLKGGTYSVRYSPGASDTGLFGGNSNWRGPVWFPVNYLLVEALERFHHFYGDTLRVECPTGSGVQMNLLEVAMEISRRLVSIFLADGDGRRPCHGDAPRYARDPHFRDLVLFNEYFHGDTGQGLGASHQTGWTALVCHLIEKIGRER